ncbi:hypothetical protein JDV02_003858 [Purpureocillium takamizusanense]|uniref:Uncharacterized protein n=1 Tax=Purpureocillium takamizusanense TaxID=2060973 RepID=A0A9Q8V9A3_9HYPO|nr:uncharacterized protein JDV02_003858 [Purpureocillium takamizusanense]UNI17523.1 hypothetical protein JDV02_003858 [Purpureocillium takamizusanense]
MRHDRGANPTSIRSQQRQHDDSSTQTTASETSQHHHSTTVNPNIARFTQLVKMKTFAAAVASLCALMSFAAADANETALPFHKITNDKLLALKGKGAIYCRAPQAPDTAYTICARLPGSPDNVWT